jgi:uncharacterized membrane protein YdjX (TVP38/TMEM64 family)
MQAEKKNRKQTTRLTYLILFWALSAFCIVLEVICIRQTKIPFLAKNKEIWIGIFTLATVLLFLLSAVFVFVDYSVFVKLLLSGNIFVAIALTVLFFLQKTEFFEIVQNVETLQGYIRKAGVWMPILYIIFQFLQVLVLPVPSIISTLAGIALFGAFQTAIFSLIGIWLGSVVAFYIGRKFGKKAVAWLIGVETLEKWQAKIKGKDNFVLTVMFLLPLFPDDLLCFVAGLSMMSWRFFLIMMSVCRILAVFTTCYSVNFIPVHSPLGMAIWGALAVILVVLFLYFYKNLDKIDGWFKRKITKNFIKKGGNDTK